METEFPVGAIDAYKDEEFLAHCFIDLDYVDRFKDADSYFLVGRRGSGKSATILRLYNEDRQPKTLITWDTKRRPDVDFFRVFVDQIIEIREHTYRDIWQIIKVDVLLRPIWELLLRVAIMQEVAKGSEDSSSLQLIKDYLRARKFDGRSPFEIFSMLVRRLSRFANVDSRDEQVRGILGVLDDEFRDPELGRACEALDDYLLRLNDTFTIYIDAILDRVVRKDELLSDVLLSLMTAVYELQPFNKKNNLRIKCTVPGEVLERIDYFDLAKLRDRCVFTHWSPRNLRRMIRARLEYLLERRSQIVVDDAWAAFFPKKIANLKLGEEDSFYYLCRHSQHYPREIILGTTELLRRAKSDHQMENEDFIRAIHRASNQMVEEFVNRNRNAFADLIEVIGGFAGKTRVLSYNEVGKIVKEATSGTDISDWIMSLIQAGFLGVVTNYRDSGSPIFKAQFAFITGQTPMFNKQTMFAIHPMFYEKFMVNREGPKYVYPESYVEDEGDG